MDSIYFSGKTLMIMPQPKGDQKFVAAFPNVLTQSCVISRWLMGHQENVLRDFLALEELGELTWLRGDKELIYRLSHTTIYTPGRDARILSHIRNWGGLILQTCQPRGSDLTWGRRLSFWER